MSAKAIDPEHKAVRLDIAKRVLLALIATEETTPHEAAQLAVSYADALIEELAD